MTPRTPRGLVTSKLFGIGQAENQKVGEKKKNREKKFFFPEQRLLRRGGEMRKSSGDKWTLKR